MSEPTLLGTIATIGNKVSATDEGRWHFTAEAPRWAVRSTEGNILTSIIAGATAFLLAVSGFWLAWHAVDKLTGSRPALAVQIGPWVAVAGLLTGACVAAYVAMGTGRLQLRMSQLTDDATTGQSGPGAAAAPNGNVYIAAIHAAEADRHAAAAAHAAGQDPAAAPAVASAESSAASAHASVADAAAGGQSGSAGGSPSTTDPAKKTSPKVWATSLAGAISFAFWTIAAATFWKNTFSSDVLAALVGATTTIVAAAAGYHRTDPLRARPGI